MILDVFLCFGIFPPLHILYLNSLVQKLSKFLACATTRARYAFLSDPQLVVDAYFHGLTSRHPRTRYRPGIDAVLYYTLSAHFPTAFQDWWFNVHPGYTVKHPDECKGKY